MNGEIEWLERGFHHGYSAAKERPDLSRADALVILRSMPLYARPVKRDNGNSNAQVYGFGVLMGIVIGMALLSLMMMLEQSA